MLETVVSLTEFRAVILGSLDREFLALAEEVLVTVMRDHQKYFAVEDEQGKLLPHFLAVLNTDADPEGVIRHGHERVLRARFNDARFFWQTDQKIPLRQRVEMLKAVTFQKDLGSYFDKTIRVQKLASQICAGLNSGDKKVVRDGIVHKAALLAKTDLTTELVKEFRRSIPGFDRRHAVTPGLTGLAQIYGHSELHRRQKLRYDLLYIKKRSFGLDLRLFIVSFLVTFLGGWEDRSAKLPRLLGGGRRSRSRSAAVGKESYGAPVPPG